MSSRRRLLFFVNPKAGPSPQFLDPERVQRVLGRQVALDWLYWEKGAPATGLIQNALDRNAYDGVVAVGGDGTVNQAAAALTGGTTPLAIIPRGSGNGLARHLKIPLKIDKALNLIATGRATAIDTARIGPRPFVCTAGVGFDAHIGQRFNAASRRGWQSYCRLALKELFVYRPRTYDLIVDGRPLTVRAFLITFGNASQWGNNAHIVPQANIRDGWLHITILHGFHPLKGPRLLGRLFNRTLHHDTCITTLRGRDISIRTPHSGPFHYDGEAEPMPAQLNVHIRPASLYVITPPGYRG